MARKLRYGFGVLLCSAMFSGCGQGLPDFDDVTVVGVDGDQVVYRYSVPGSGFDTPPSSLWTLDLETGKSRRFLEATLQFSPQIAGDYYVTELVREERTLGRVVVGEIGTSRRHVIHERTLRPHNSSPSNHLAAGDLAVVLADGNLLVTELSDPDSRRTIAVPECARELIALDHTRAFLECKPASSSSEEASTLVMIDLVTEDVTEFPSAPGHSQPSYHDAHLSDSHLVVSRINGERDEERINQILTLDLATSTWRVLADVGQFNIDPLHLEHTSVTGLEGVNILVERWTYSPPLSDWSLEIIDLESGASRTIVERSGFFDLIPLGGVLSDGRVIWYEPGIQAVAVRDLFLDETSLFRVRLPN